MYRLAWWKILAIVLAYYVIILGFLHKVPRLDILHESVRNLFFHTCMWFTMIILLTASVVLSVRYLKSNKIRHDIVASEFANTGILFGLLGMITGSLWARYTWGSWWVNDPKLNGAAICMLIYFAYVILRGSIEDFHQKARVSAIYNIFAWATLIPLLFILPRMTDSLHPGNGGNPGFSSYDLDNNLRLVFYPAIIGWTLLGVWITELRIRRKELENKLEAEEL